MGFSLFTDLITPTKYKVPEAATVDLKSEQLANVDANAATFDAAKGLAAQYNDFMQQQVSNRLKQTMPEFAGLEAQASANYAAQLRGELTTSDAAASQRSSAAQALRLGTFNSPAGGALQLRNLGLRQAQVQQQAQAQLPNYLSAITGIQKAPLFDFSNAFLTAGQRVEYQFKNATNRFNVQNLRNQMAAQPPAWQKALAGFGDSILDAVASYYTMGASGMANGVGKGANGRSTTNTGFNVGDAQQQLAQEAEFSGGGLSGASSEGWGYF